MVNYIFCMGMGLNVLMNGLLEYNFILILLSINYYLFEQYGVLLSNI